mmetsp:Transcript_6010/g.9309  ORF Transcript_6010/g.9309 Transcript_6010/m.9309 type:complete len:623 (+) Transcript_6010:68-1936(+)
MPISNISPPPSNESSKAAASSLLGLQQQQQQHVIVNLLPTSTTTSNITAYRPRLLYSALFTWNTITCGKFIAPFLQDLSPHLFTDGVVGMTLAVQYAIVAVFAGYGGRLSDVQEKRCQRREQLAWQRRQQQHDNTNGNYSYSGGGCWGLGRLKVLSYSILLGTCAILGHAVPSLYTQYYDIISSSLTNNNVNASNYNPEQHQQVQFPYELAWQVSMRCIYALSLAIMAPCLDGLALAHLDCIDGASQADFGKERMYGAAFWGMGSLCVGLGMDRYGFGFLYVMTVLSAVMSYAAIGVYLVGLRRDTTGAFVTAATVVVAPMESSSSPLLLDRVGEEDWNGVISYMDAEQRKRETSSPLNEVEAETNKTTSALQLFQLICQSGYGKALLFFVFSLAVGISIVDNLAFIFFDTLGSSNTMNGLTVVFTVLFEIPIFYLAPRFLQSHGPGKLLLAAGIAYVVRVIGYTVAPHMSVVLLLETLHGISYAGGKAGSVEYIAQIAPKGFEATGQGLLIFVNYAGIVTGLFVGGHIQEAFGSVLMFYVMAIIVGLGTVVLLIAEICLGAPKRDNDDEENNNNNNPDGESTNLIKSESACSSGSYADRATENFMRKNLKYDSLNKYVKDW